MSVTLVPRIILFTVHNREYVDQIKSRFLTHFYCASYQIQNISDTLHMIYRNKKGAENIKLKSRIGIKE